MSQGAWKVYSNVFDNKKMYIVGRQIDTTKPLHGGNIKYAPDMEYTEDRQIAEDCAHALNAIEKGNKVMP